jgi:RHS repeat-associated protein
MNKPLLFTKSVIAVTSFVVICFSAAALDTPAPGTRNQRDPKQSDPSVSISLKALNLSRAPTREELMAAGQLGGPLFPTHELADKRREEAASMAFGQAIEEWNKHEYPNAVQLFKKHVQQFPDSPWAAEAALHIGCDATYNGRYSEAEAIFTQLIATCQGNEDPGAKMMLNKARQRLALVKVEENNLEEANKLFLDLEQNSPDWKQRTYAAHWLQRLSRFAAAKQALLNCGADALAYVLKKDGHQAAATQVQNQIPHSMRGHSMSELVKLAADQGYEMVALNIATSDLAQLPLPAVVHISEGNSGDKGHYWVLDKVQGNELEMYDPQSSRRFHQTAEELAMQWSGDVLVLSKGNKLPGRKMDASEMEEAIGGCCGAPTAPDNLGSPGRNGASDSGSDNNSCGAPKWSVDMISMNMFVTDTPMWYDPPIGPPVRISLSYNSQSSIAQYEPFGSKWTFSYGGYLIMDTSGTITIFMPDGREDVYPPNGAGGYNTPYRVYNKLTQIAPNHFQLQFPDGTIYVYQIPAGTSSQQPFLTEIDDPYGQKLSLGYDASVRLTTITDAQGKIFMLTYNASGLVTNVADPFGRNASFQYDGNKNLTKITDMGGYWSTLAYDTNVFVTSIGDERGTTYFYTEVPGPAGNNSDNYPPPGDPNMFANYRITVTNAVGGVEEFFYYGGCDIDGYGGCGGYSWYVSPRDYIRWQSQQVNNYRSEAPKTRYLPTRVASGQHGEIAKILHPEGDYIQYGYDTVTGDRTSVTDNQGHTWRYTYNAMGRVTAITDARSIAATFSYAANNVDLLSISNGLGQVTLTCNPQHDITSITDRLANSTSFAYNANGQILSQADALGITNQYVYDSSNHLAIFKRAGQTLESYTYDAVGRARTRTDATGFTVTNDYNNLNQVTRISYPDGRFESYAYSTCCPRLLDSVTDRAGRTTSFLYDALKRPTQTVNPESGITQFGYDANGNRSALTDPNGNATAFAYDLDNRAIRKTYADGKGLSFRYDADGLLTTRTNARGITTACTYDANHNLLTIRYSDGTPGVTNTYDNFNRIVQQVDGIGTNSYAYDANSRLLGFTGPWPSDTITYSYDTLGRRTNLTAQLGQPVGYVYDALNRLAQVQTSAGNYTYGYSGVSPLVQTLTRPNGSYITNQYDNLNRLMDISNKKSTGQVINEFSYTYNTQDLRGSETVSNGLSLTFSNQLVTYNYNALNQVLTSTPPSQVFAYDDDGNMTRGYTSSNYVFTAAYDAENRLKSLVYTDGSGVVCSNQYVYSGNWFLAQVKEYQNGALSNDTRFVRVGYLPVQERSVNNTVTREYAWGANTGGGIGGLLNLKQAGQDYSYLYDGKGNVMMLLDSTQATVASYAYDAFGVLLSSVGSLEQPFRFSTKPYDLKTGLLDFGYRWYAPLLGRWSGRDLIAEKGGINLYTFVGANPVSRIDPWGLQGTGQLLGDTADLLDALRESKENADKLQEAWRQAHGIYGGLDNELEWEKTERLSAESFYLQQYDQGDLKWIRVPDSPMDPSYYSQKDYDRDGNGVLTGDELESYMWLLKKEREGKSCPLK